MHKIMFSCYAQDSGNVNSWRLGGTVLQTFLRVPPLEVIAALLKPPGVSLLYSFS